MYLSYKVYISFQFAYFFKELSLKKILKNTEVGTILEMMINLSTLVYKCRYTIKASNHNIKYHSSLFTEKNIMFLNINHRTVTVL